MRQRHLNASVDSRGAVTTDTIDLTGGSVIDFGQSAEEPVEVVINGRLVARGEAVMVQGNYGVRISQIESRSERLEAAPAPGGNK